MQELAEPSPRVWNSIEIALRQEGIIREPQPGTLAGAASPRRWNLGHGWLRWRPLALVAFGIGVYQRGSGGPQSVAQLTADGSGHGSQPTDW